MYTRGRVDARNKRERNKNRGDYSLRVPRAIFHRYRSAAERKFPSIIRRRVKAFARLFE